MRIEKLGNSTANDVVAIECMQLHLEEWSLI